MAALFLVLIWVRHYAWAQFPAEMQGDAWKIGSALAILTLMAIVWRGHKSALLIPFILLLAFEEIQVILCSAWWILEPWTVLPGYSKCHSGTGFDLGAIGILAMAVLANKIILGHDKK